MADSRRQPPLIRTRSNQSWKALTLNELNDHLARKDYRREPPERKDYRREPPERKDYRHELPARKDYRREPPARKDYRREPPVRKGYRPVLER